MADLTQELIEAYRPTFSDMWMSVVQQETERLSDTTLIETELEGRAHRYQKTDKRTMKPMTARFENSNPTESKIETRWMYGTGYDDEIKFSRRDIPRLEKLALPTSQGMAEQRKALNRLYDQTKIDNLFADANVGENDQAPTAVPLPAGNTIAVDFVRSGAAADSGMTLHKFLRAHTKINQADWDPGVEKIFLLGPQQVEDMYADINEFRNNDFRNKNGTFDRAELVTTGRTFWMGTTFIVTNLLPIVSGTDHRKCVLYVKDSIVFGSENPETFMDLIATKKHQIQIRFEVDPIASTRIYEEGVYPIICDE